MDEPVPNRKGTIVLKNIASYMWTNALIATVVVTAACAGLLVHAPSATAGTVGVRTVAATTATDENVLNDYEKQVQDEINKARVAADLPKLKLNACADSYAETWAAKQAKAETFVSQDLTKVIDGCKTRYAGEALGRGDDVTAQALVAAWLASPKHSKVLLSAKPTHFAVGTKAAADGTYYTDVVTIKRK